MESTLKTLHPLISSVLLACLLLANTAAAAPPPPLNNRELGAGYAHLLGFAAEPEVSATVIDIEPSSPETDSMRLKNTRLPLHREFAIEGSEIRWFAQGSLGYLELTETQHFDLSVEETLALDSEWQSWTGLFEAGLVVPLGRGFSLSPSLSAGLSRLDNELEFSDAALEDLLRPVFDGKLYNWSTNATIGRAHLALLYDQEHGRYRIKAGAHLSYAYVDSYNESRGFAGFSDGSGTAIVKLDVVRRINDPAASRRISLIGHLGSVNFIGDNRDELGFEQLNEVGLALGIDKYALGVMAVFGEQVDGWSITFNYGY